MMNWGKHILSLFVVCFGVLIIKSAQASLAHGSIISADTYQKITSYLLVSSGDMKAYERMFRALDEADFQKFEKARQGLENYILLGTALAEKYLHPKYRSNLQELAVWLENYNSHPQAQRIYRLAKRKGGKSGELKAPVYIDSGDGGNSEIGNYVKGQSKQFRRYINRGKTKPARLILENGRFRSLAPAELWDDLAATLAQKYLVDNYDRLAYDWATRAARRHNSGTATWVAGLAAWRMKQYQNAAQYFSRLGKSKNSDEWLVAAGAYWAARAYEKLGNRPKSAEMLKIATRYKHTFYGILAAQKLGQKLKYNWQTASYFNDFNSQDYVYELLSSPYIRRAILLLGIKRHKLAAQELRFGSPKMNEKQKEASMFIAGQYGLHSLAINLTNQLRKLPKQKAYDDFAYPLPNWLPSHGWKIDKALVLGMIRQESAFRPDAVSVAGARGLMQLMPNTAYHITKDVGIKRDKNRLFKTDYNLRLGQQYISYLLDKPFINGNLFYMIAAYNAGPGNLMKWQKLSRYQDDALLFIEVIPSSQTRIYIERVMANYWIYNMRFERENKSLEQITKGLWPKL